MEMVQNESLAKGTFTAPFAPHKLVLDLRVKVLEPPPNVVHRLVLRETRADDIPAKVGVLLELVLARLRLDERHEALALRKLLDALRHPARRAARLEPRADLAMRDAQNVARDAAARDPPRERERGHTDDVLGAVGRVALRLGRDGGGRALQGRRDGGGARWGRRRPAE